MVATDDDGGADLASRDQVIGDLIENLNDVLDHIGDRDEQLTELIKSFQVFIGGLKEDREAILGSLDQISALSVQTADLVTGIRPGLRRDIKGLRAVAGTIVDNRAEVDRALKVLPVKLTKVGRTAIYGSFFNFYLCNFRGTIDLPGPAQPIQVDAYDTGAERCNIG